MSLFKFYSITLMLPLNLTVGQKYRATGEPACGDEPLRSFHHRWGTKIPLKVKPGQLGQYSCGHVPHHQSMHDAR